MRQRDRASSGPPEAAPACTLPGLPSATIPDKGLRRCRPAARWPGAAALGGLLLLGGCAATVPPPLTSVPGLCRLAPDDGPPLADRGIGGTGAPTTVADRGIGGTGTPMRAADRGIGGTGIVAVITGFASICLGGVEVALDPSVPVTLDGQPIAASALRAGQVAIIDAAGSGTALRARSVDLRQEVSGPVEAVGTDGRLRVAGQAVRLAATTLGERRPVAGQWVSVSGLRGPDGVVQATRIDRRAPGEVLVRGQATMQDGRLRIGGLTLRSGGTAEASGFVTATGRYEAGALADVRLRPDRLASDPAAVFPTGTRQLLVESYAVAAPGGLRLGAGPVLPGVAGLGAGEPRRAVVAFEREPGGGFRATGLRQEGPGLPPGPASFLGDMRDGGQGGGPRGGTGGGAPGRVSQPAPVPRGGAMNDAGQGPGRSGGGAPRGGRQPEPGAAPSATPLPPGTAVPPLAPSGGATPPREMRDRR